MTTHLSYTGSARFWSDPSLKPIEWQNKGKGAKGKQRSWCIEPKAFKTNFFIGDIVIIISANKSMSGASKLKNKLGIVWQSKSNVSYPDIVCIGEEALPLSLLKIEKLIGKINYKKVESLMLTMKNLRSEQEENCCRINQEF